VNKNKKYFVQDGRRIIRKAAQRTLSAEALLHDLFFANPTRKMHLHEVVLILDRVATSQVNGLGELDVIEFIFRWHVFAVWDVTDG
jgi:hypothetical protein